MARPQSPSITDITAGPPSPLSPTKVPANNLVSHPPSASVTDTTSISTTSELERFREQWLKEVRQHHQPPNAASAPTVETSASTSGNTQDDAAESSIPTSSGSKPKARTRSPQIRKSVDLPPPLSTSAVVPVASVSSYPAVELAQSKTRSALVSIDYAFTSNSLTDTS